MARYRILSTFRHSETRELHRRGGFYDAAERPEDLIGKGCLADTTGGKDRPPPVKLPPNQSAQPANAKDAKPSRQQAARNIKDGKVVNEAGKKGE